MPVALDRMRLSETDLALLFIFLRFWGIHMFKKLREKINIFTVKNPSRAILIAILLLNIVLFLVAAGVISLLAPKSLANHGFWSSVYYTISMVLDAGCISYVIADIGEASVALILVCILTVVLGMITFTGAVIGYVTNYISSFIENSKSGIRAVKASGHTVILNWNSRASEIINDLLYTGQKEVVVVLANQNSDEIEREIDERLTATIKNENAHIKADSKKLPWYRRFVYYRTHRLRNLVTVIVRDGETYSTKQLNDTSIAQARTVILLTKEYRNDVCRYGNRERQDLLEKGNANTVKTLVQVAEITSGEDSADAQTIIVEVEDEWTAMLVNRIIAHKEKMAKCHIIPIYVNKVLGQILSQFSIMPELNTVYSELFSNRGAEFFFKKQDWVDDVDAETEAYLRTHRHAIPLTIMKTASGNHAFSVANSNADCELACDPIECTMETELNQEYDMIPRTIVIIGHNSKCGNIMDGFNAFCAEHGRTNADILNITVIDDEKNLERMDYYKAYPYVRKTVVADVYDSDAIKNTIREAIDSHSEDTSLLILSDDQTIEEDIDSAALTYLIYVQDIISERIAANPDFKRESVDVIVEILNPKNYDVVHNFSADNVVISNRYISKMVTQIGRKQALFEFYSDILTYDDEDSESFDSKELYAKEVKLLFKDGKLPPKCKAGDLIRSVYKASPFWNKMIVIGYARPGQDLVLFEGDQYAIDVELTEEDKLIVFSNH